MVLVFFSFLSVSGQNEAVKLGDTVPDITIRNHVGTYNNLFNSLGEITIIHFWGSWSKACIPMNKFLGSLYDKYKADGLVIFSVSIDKKPRHWLDQINKQGLNWPLHGSDFRGLIHSTSAKDYKIFEVPSTFVVNEYGVLLFFNPEKNVLEQYLKDEQQRIKVIPTTVSDRLYLTKKTDYEILRNDTVIFAGKGDYVNFKDVALGDYSIAVDDRIYMVQKKVEECTVDFQVNYKQQNIDLSKESSYLLKNKNGNIILRGEGVTIDYSGLNLKGKHVYYLEVENGAFLVKLW